MITLYTKPICPFCNRAKAWLTKHDIPFETIDITEDDSSRNFLKEAGHKTVPQIYVGTRLLVEGGFEGLSKCHPRQLRENIDVITEELQQG